jgi:hypothetical protein
MIATSAKIKILNLSGHWGGKMRESLYCEVCFEKQIKQGGKLNLAYFARGQITIYPIVIYQCIIEASL